VSGNDVYVGGLFNGVPTYPSVPGTRNVAKWNSTTGTWSALGDGVAGYVYAIAVSGSDVYVGGLFNAASDVPNTLDFIENRVNLLHAHL
jgi:trimeric autotransporter adhesin